MLTGDATNQSQVYSLQTLVNAGITANNFGVVYNINETGPIPNDTSLNSFSLDIYNADGTLAGQIHLTDTGIYPLTNQGVGGSGYLFTVQAGGPGDSLATFFANPSAYYIGASGSISLTDDGPETFYIVNAANPVPEPTTLLLLGTGLSGVAAWARRRRRRNP